MNNCLQSIAKGSGKAESVTCSWQSIASEVDPTLEFSQSSNLCLNDVFRYQRAALADSTRRAYESDFSDFVQWGGNVPSTPEIVARYLADRADTLSPYTLQRRLIAISHAHRACRMETPCGHDIVRSTLRGIRRVKSMKQRRVDPLLADDLRQVLDFVPNTLRGKRDRAILLVGFAGAFRRSELATITVANIRFVSEGMLINLPRSKTDQQRRGRTVAIPIANGSACAVEALKQWLSVSDISRDTSMQPGFRGIVFGQAWLPQRQRLASACGRFGSKPDTSLTPWSSGIFVKPTYLITTWSAYFCDKHDS
jgi:integrase